MRRAVCQLSVLPFAWHSFCTKPINPFSFIFQFDAFEQAHKLLLEMTRMLRLLDSNQLHMVRSTRPLNATYAFCLFCVISCVEWDAVASINYFQHTFYRNESHTPRHIALMKNNANFFCNCHSGYKTSLADSHPCVWTVWGPFENVAEFHSLLLII